MFYTNKTVKCIQAMPSDERDRKKNEKGTHLKQINVSNISGKGSDECIESDYITVVILPCGECCDIRVRWLLSLCVYVWFWKWINFQKVEEIQCLTLWSICLDLWWQHQSYASILCSTEKLYNNTMFE